MYIHTQTNTYSDIREQSSLQFHPFREIRSSVVSGTTFRINVTKREFAIDPIPNTLIDYCCCLICGAAFISQNRQRRQQQLTDLNYILKLYVRSIISYLITRDCVLVCECVCYQRYTFRPHVN